MSTKYVTSNQKSNIVVLLNCSDIDFTYL